MKHKHTLTKNNTALLVIDVQDKFAPVIPDFDYLVTNVARLVLTFRMFKLPVIVTEQYPDGLGNTVEKVRRQFDVLEVVEKIELAATENKQFMEKVNTAGCDTFVVCGIETHVCVNQTVLGLLERGKTVHVVVDAVASRRAIDHSTGLRKMENAGALATTTETVMFELAERAGTESFKNIQTMIKDATLKTSAKKAQQPNQSAEKKAPSAAAKAVERKPLPVVESPKPTSAPMPVPNEAKAAEEPLDAVDIELAAAAKDSEAVDINDILGSIDKKIVVNEPVGVPDKDIADLEEIMKLEETSKLERPDIKKREGSK
jgi:nicotinamidase-related amidase